MNDLQIYVYSGEQLRTVQQPDGLWWVLRDVCRVLGMSNPAMVAQRLDEDEKAEVSLSYISSNGVEQKRATTIINESGLYAVILRSDKPEAREFKRWVTHEVLPAIRKTGSYSVQPKLPQTYLEALKALVASEEEKQKLLAENTEMKPKAEYFDDLVDRNLLTNFRETAKELGVKEKAFIQWLISSKYLYRDQSGKLLPYANATSSGLFEVKEYASKRNSWSGTQTLVTPKGRETFRLLYRES